MKQEAAPERLGDDYITLIYEVDQTELSKFNQHKLQAFLEARIDVEQEEISVMAWPDVEYDPKGQNAQNFSLARERAWKIKDYIHQHSPTAKEVIVFNMARGPRTLDRIFRTEEFDVKSNFEKGGLTSTVLPDGRVSYTKASKVIVLIEKEDKI